MYYIFDSDTDADGNIMRVKYKRDVRGRSFITGQKFSSEPGAKKWETPPAEPIRLDIEEGDDLGPMPHFICVPVPVVSSKLLEVLQGSGVNNIDAYKTEIYNPNGSLYSNEYYVINIVGLIAAADLEKSKFDGDQPQRKIAMGFDSLVVDESKTYGSLMFRLAENVSEILIHGNLKNAIEKAGLDHLLFYETEYSVTL